MVCRQQQLMRERRTELASRKTELLESIGTHQDSVDQAVRRYS
jgi:hypothetical protein